MRDFFVVLSAERAGAGAPQVMAPQAVKCPTPFEQRKPQKEFALGGAFILLSSLVFGMPHYPTKNALYADATEYCWFAVHRQRNLSSTSLSVKPWRRLHKLMYCCSTGMERDPTMSVIQELLWNASATLRSLAALLFTAANKVGYLTSMAPPSSHLSF
jgi:hypothetical protein